VSGLPGCAAWVRRRAEQELGLANDRSVLPILIARMSAAQTFHQLDAAWRIGKLGDPAGLHALHLGLKSKDDWVKLESLASMAELGRRGGYVHVAKILEGSLDWPVREYAVALLGESGDRGAVEPVRASLGDRDSWVRLSAMRALARLQGEEALPDAYSVTEDADALEAKIPDALRRAAASRRYLRDCLRERASSQKGEEQRLSALALARTNDASAWRSVTGQLSSGESSERIAAAITLGRIGDPRAAPAMLEQMNEDAPWASRSLRGALRRMGDAAVPALTEALNHEDERVRAAAHATIQEITGAKVAFNPKEENPKRRAVWIKKFRVWWQDYTFLRELGYDSVALFQKAHALAINGLIDGATRLKIEELRKRQEKMEGD